MSTKLRCEAPVGSGAPGIVCSVEEPKARTKKKPDAHVVILTGRGGSFGCLHCGAEYKGALPAPVSIVVAASKAFNKDHRRCRLRSEGAYCPSCLRTGHGAEACPLLEVATIEQWLCGPDTGISSRAIVGAIVGSGYLRWNGGQIDASTPRDPSDFGRCHRLLKRFPRLRPSLHIVAEKHPEWAPLVREWDLLTSTFERESRAGTNAPETYALIQKLNAEGGAR